MLSARSRELSAGKGLTLQEFKDQLAALDKEMRSLPATAQVSFLHKSVALVVRPADARCLRRQQAIFCCTPLVVSQPFLCIAVVSQVPMRQLPGTSQLQWVQQR